MACATNEPRSALGDGHMDTATSSDGEGKGLAGPDRIRMRQERNRLAAKKCREKKQREYQELEKEAGNLKAENLALRAQLTQLHKDLQELKALTGKNKGD